MFTQLHSRNCPIAVKQCSRSSCFGASCNRPYPRRRQQVMTRADAAPDRRESIAFTGSAGDVTAPDTEVVQGVEPAPRPVSQQPPSVWAAGIALGIGIACSVAWRQITGQNSKRKAETQQTDPQTSMPTSSRTAPVRNFAQTSSTPPSQDNLGKADFPNRLSATKTAPVVNSSASLHADARAVRDRLTEQRKPATDVTRPDAAPDAAQKLTPKPAEKVAEKPTQKPTQQLAEQPAEKPTQKPADRPSPQTSPPPAKGLAQAEAKPSQRGLPSSKLSSDSAAAPKPGGSPPAKAAPSSAPQSAAPSSKQSEAKSDTVGLSDGRRQADAAAAGPSSKPAPVASKTPAQPPSKESEPKPSLTGLSEKAKQSEADADTPPKQDAPPSSQLTSAAAPPSPKQSDAKPSATDKEKLSAAAPAMAPKADAKQQPEPKPESKPLAQGSSAPATTKPDTGSDSVDSTTLEPVRSSATPDAEEKKGKAEAADQDSKPEEESVHDLIAASSSDEEVPEAFKTFDGNLPDVPEPDASQQGPKLFQSAPKTDAILPPSQKPQSPERVNPRQDTAAQDLEAQPIRPASEEEATQLRERMQQLRQAMAAKDADVAAAEEASSQSQQQQQQQQRADKQSSEFMQQQEDLAEAAQQEGDKQEALMSEKQQQGKAAQSEKAASDAKPRVLARPTSGDSATIFLEKPGADDGLQRSPTGDEGEESVDLVAVSAGIVLPHPDKTETGGEDAFFVSSHGRGAFGVADGVGGWNLEGVDPSRYSRLLMEHAEKAILRGKGDSEDGARNVVGYAHDTITRQSEEEGADILGSSTMCLGIMRPGGVVEIANLGDSGFRVLRGSEIVFASEAQQHSFNMPYQLAVPGPDQYSDTCESAVVYELELHPGDVIIAATDGVLDNLWDHQIAMLVHQFLGAEPRSVASAQACARMLVKTARYNSLDPKTRSPWAVESAKMGAVPWWKRLRPEGGKIDDCTAVVVCLEPAGAMWDSDRQAITGNGQAAVPVA